MDRVPPGEPAFHDAPRTPAVAPRELLTRELAMVDQLTARVCRRHRLTADERDEFAGHVRLKLVEDDYAILRSFRHRSSLRTYLHVVIERLFLDYRTARWGRWRPSAKATANGAVAVLLDRLMTRDGLSFDEACAVVQTNHRIDVSRQALYAISVQLPARANRRLVPCDGWEHSLAADGSPEDDLAREEAGRVAARVKRALQESVSRLTPADRRLFDMRFREGRAVVDIARALGQPPEPLYRRLEHIVQKIRRPVRAAAVGLAGSARDAFRAGDVNISW